jgi:uncharacterized membrane protein YbjE (DUF340 family)
MYGLKKKSLVSESWYSPTALIKGYFVHAQMHHHQNTSIFCLWCLVHFLFLFVCVCVGWLVGWLTRDIAGAHSLVTSHECVCMCWLVGWLTRDVAGAHTLVVFMCVSEWVMAWDISCWVSFDWVNLADRLFLSEHQSSPWETRIHVCELRPP